MAETITNDNFKSEVLESDVPVIVDFWAVWCMPCQMLNPILDSISEQYGDKVKIAKINVDEQQELAGKYGIMSIPTVMIFNKGEQIQQFTGVQHKDTYTSAVEELVVE